MKFWFKIFGINLISSATLKEREAKKSELIHRAVHDLRTPLAIAKTNSEVVLMKGQSLPVHEALDAIRSNLEEIDRMSALLSSISEENKREEAKGDMPPPFNISEIRPKIRNFSQ